MDDENWKFNHYAFLSQHDAHQKSAMNKNPFLTEYDDEMDEFFSRVEDTEIQYYVPELKERMLRSIRQYPIPHPDDWEPSS